LKLIAGDSFFAIISDKNLIINDNLYNFYSQD